MSYITQNDIALLKLQLGDSEQTSRIIRDLIEDDMTSQAKKDMEDGVNYFKAEHSTILAKDFRTYYIRHIKHTDLNASNNKLINTFHTILVNQKNSYICGNPVVISPDDETNDKLLEDIKNLLDEDNFNDLLCSWELNSSNKGFETLHPYTDENGQFHYAIVDAEQIIPIYDSKLQMNLVELIRYYKVEYIDANKSKNERFRVEWWTANNVTYFIENGEGGFVLDPDKEVNPAPHFSNQNTATGSRLPGSWGKVPFVLLKNNNYQTSDLKLIKSLIDDYDLNSSDFSNNLADIQEAIWKLAGYEGENLSEARENMKVYKMVKVAEDGNLEPMQLDIPREARDSHLNRLEDNIYMFGMGVNPNKLGDGNITNVVIKSRYALLDLKANVKIRKFTRALSEFMYFPLVYLNQKNPDEIKFKFTFNKNLIINTQENVMNASMSKGIISDQTLLENHPFVDDVEQEKERIEEERKQKEAQFTSVLIDQGDNQDEK